jgi:phosphoglycerate dehydrogenase-like enzyme
MSFTLIMLPPQSTTSRSWADRLASELPGVTVLTPADTAEAIPALQRADAAFGSLPEELVQHARGLRWLQAPAAGPPAGFYNAELVRHPTVVTNMRGTYTDLVAAHAVALLLALARRLPQYTAQQYQGVWLPDPDPGSYLYFPEATLLIVGVGALGAEVARLMAAFGSRILATDARLTEAPPHVESLYPPQRLDDLLPAADAVIVTAPHTPSTERLFAKRTFDLMKEGSFFVNVGRGAIVDTDDLIDALRSNRLRGAGLDVLAHEPLPAGHPLWTTPGVILTPHVAAAGFDYQERRYAVLLDNAQRFAAGKPLINVVDKERWF